MNELKIFESLQFGQVRTTEDNSKVLFCGNDIAKALGYSKPHDAVNAHCRYTVKHSIPHPQSKDKTIDMSFIPEGDVYRLITHSKLPAAEQFEKWVFDEVLPSIRKHGVYAVDNLLNDPDALITALQGYKLEREQRLQLEAKVQQDAPKVLFANSVTASKQSILIGELAKLIKQNGVDMGQIRLFEWMRANDYLMKTGSSRNLPTQHSMEMGLYEIKEFSVLCSDGSIRITRTTKVTGKGQVYFINKFLSGVELEEQVK